jgi:hypothetical protein
MDFTGKAQANGIPNTASIFFQTERTVSHSTAVRWVAENILGHKLLGYKG